MVLVAIVGPVGAGKTTLLSEFVEWMQDGSRPVDGFLAVPIERKMPGRGAGEYVLQWIRSGERRSFVTRDLSLSPPYRINPETLAFAEQWAGDLSHGEPIPCIVLDEFGPIEAAGNGHVRTWEIISKLQPSVVVLAVREGYLTQIEHRLGVRPDVLVDPRDGEAAGRLRSVVLHHADWTMVGAYGAVAGGIEASLGSALHAGNVPLRGLFMASLQSVIMVHAGDRMASRGRVVWVPFISAGLKALSPSGNRVRPMVAIAAQGMLFGVATTLLGWTGLGVSVGGWLVGAWSACQALVFQYLFIGQDFLRALDVVVGWLSELLQLGDGAFVALIAGWVSFCGLLSASATLWAWQRRHRRSKKFSALLEKGARGIAWAPYHPSRLRALRYAMRDLLRPYFWIPLFVIVAILLSSGTSWENALWVIVRAVTVAYVLFSLVRMVDPNAIVVWLERRGYWGPAMALRRALSVAQSQRARGSTLK